jgi:lipoprotein-anchoring transpeptidase ErfK/SrfK
MPAPLHRSDTRSTGPKWLAPVVSAGIAVSLVGGGTAALIAFHGSNRAASNHGGSIPTSSHSHPAPVVTVPPVPLNVVSTAPATGAADVSYSPTVTVQLTAPLASGSPLPTLTPQIAGSWSDHDDTLVFQPSAQFTPYTTVQLTIPGGNSGLRDAGGETLPKTLTSTFSVEGGSELRLQQLLAELEYLPLSFVRSGTTGSALASEATTASDVQLSPLAGSFEWRYPDTPSLLSAQWTPATDNVLTRGAVMAFEARSGLTVDGEAGPIVWNALVAAVAARHIDPAAYDYIMVSEKYPETLYLWQDGQVLFSVDANTGISEDPTAPGTYPVYARFLVTTMSGKNPNGTKYHDPGIPHVAYFNGGDAIHGFIRSGYGYPQSLGCVELSYADAAQVWPYDQLGTLVTVY